ncbi:hypothetical protein PILCRDRAFT_725200 [Piloderma croceum F 1598]|uniref:Uncharacterized protein n=1 Tax=Piloderma croceum (strain F 1598) TaxID=765440 RepID=A0A0C3AI99_PILCF|nr:hypothetical protein PILCRDRAFT_725200 [Piloderma croceum F 1598]
MSSKPGLSTRLTMYTKNHPCADDSGGKALENALNQLKEAKKQTKKRKDTERQCKAKLQAEDNAEACLKNGGGKLVTEEARMRTTFLMTKSSKK